jgi:short-chain Z-isoprenyl diphosphate synthase
MLLSFIGGTTQTTCEAAEAVDFVRSTRIVKLDKTLTKRVPVRNPLDLLSLALAAGRIAALPVYRAYERRLLQQVKGAPVPRHVGLILDGNRRYGRQHNLTDPREIYEAGAEKLDALLDWCAQLTIPAITLWVFSTDNFDRPPKEVSGILTAVEAKLKRLAEDPQIHRQRVRVRGVGRLELLPEPTLAALRAAETATAGYDGIHLAIAAAYGGRQEITDAVQALLREQQAKGKGLEEAIPLVTPQTLGRYLYAPDLPDPDLIIRTSGEIRLSGFLLWQSAYSEFYFTDVFWPALRKIDFLRVVRAFQQRRRRFGR